MKNKEIELFVPGRLCLLGEHSDWAGKYRSINNKIEKGYAIVTGIEEGIYATASVSEKLVVKSEIDSKIYFECDMNYNKLKNIAESGEYWSYVAGVAACVKEQYNISGIEIVIKRITIPEKKGLSSSAAVCVLVARAFNQLYNLHLNTVGEMNLAYLGEITTPSRCGRLDQACAYGKKPILMVFDGEKIEIKNIKVEKDMYFVFADLMSKKNTVKILGDLNRSYPFASNIIDENVQKCFGKLNKEIIEKSIVCIENGNLEELGNLMNEAQLNFDKYVMPASPQELRSPVLHKVMKNQKIIDLAYGIKGVGSQGDGTVQFLAKNKECQEKLKKYLQDELKMTAYTLTIDKTKPVKKAIIPVAGNGTRMFPITKCFKKSFLPIIDSDGVIKPAILSLVEELDEAGIDEICLIIDEEDKLDYDRFFKSSITEDVASKLSPEMLKYESKIRNIGNKLIYIYQKEKLGLGHAVSLCQKFAGDDPVLLVLGDQLYKTNNSLSCTTQLLNNFSKTGKLSVSVCEIDLSDVSKYGILSGVKDNNDYFIVDKMVEKPDQSIAEEKYYVLNHENDKNYYAVFGEYVLTPNVFNILKEHIKNKKLENGEYQITSALDEEREKNGMVAFIPDGEMLDIGNVNSYKKTIIKKMN